MYNEKFIEVTSKNIHQDSVAASLVAINLTKFIAQIKEEDKWEKSDRNAITIFKSFLLRMVLIALHKGAEMKQHIKSSIISIQVIEGEMIFTTDDQTITLSSGQILVLQEGLLHSVLAKEDTIFLLTLTTT